MQLFEQIKETCKPKATKQKQIKTNKHAKPIPTYFTNLSQNQIKPKQTDQRNKRKRKLTNKTKQRN